MVFTQIRPYMLQPIFWNTTQNTGCFFTDFAKNDVSLVKLSNPKRRTLEIWLIKKILEFSCFFWNVFRLLNFEQFQGTLFHILILARFYHLIRCDILFKNTFYLVLWFTYGGQGQLANIQLPVEIFIQDTTFKHSLNCTSSVTEKAVLFIQHFKYKWKCVDI